MFFDVFSPKSPTLSIHDVKKMASDISKAYTSDGVPPTETLTKIAQQRSLTPHQIEVLAGEANKMIHIEKYASAEDKYFAADFPLADSKVVIQELQNDASEKTAASSEFLGSPVVDEEFDTFKAFGVEDTTAEKTANEIVSPKRIMEKLAQARDEEHRKLAEATSHKNYAENAYLKTANAHIAAGCTSSERMEKMGMAYHAARCADLEDTARPLLRKLAYVYRGQGLLTEDHYKVAEEYFSKEADETAPEGLISDWINAKVVNGDHPLIITLDTYKKGIDRERELAEYCNLVDDKIRIYGQKIRAL